MEIDCKNIVQSVIKIDADTITEICFCDELVKLRIDNTRLKYW